MNHPALHLHALDAGYAGPRPLRVLHALDLRVPRGEWLGVLGPNGSGKSTLLDCVAGRHAGDGTILIDGVSLADEPMRARARLGYAVAPESLPPVLSGRECLAVHAAARGLDAEAQVLELAGPLRLAARLDDPVATYSYGMRQKLGVLLALIGEPALIVLDESFNGLDPASSLVLKRHLRARADAGRCGIVLATHALDIVERWVDRAIVLHAGRFVGEWDRVALDALRDGVGLEVAMAEAIGDRIG